MPIKRPVKRRTRVMLIVLLVPLVLVPVVAYAAWTFASQIGTDALEVTHGPTEYGLTVLAVDPETMQIGLAEADRADLLSDEILGIGWPGGYAQLGRVTASDESSVTRSYELLAGEGPAPGTPADLDSFAFPRTPGAHRLPFTDVTYSSPFGEFDAWLVPGPGSTWVVLTHGRGVDRGEAIRILPVTAAAGHPSLVITYRNDEGQPATDDRLARFGATEWEDLEAAVRYALDHGAADVVLYGFSMGGAISVSFLLESPLADRVRAVILDAPALDLEAVIDARSAETNLPVIPVRVPAALGSLAKSLAERRFSFDFDSLDYVARSGDLPDVPVLLFHGDADGTVPVDTSDRLARLRPDIVTYERFSDTGHVRAWNVDRDRYETAVADFLAELQAP